MGSWGGDLRQIKHLPQSLLHVSLFRHLALLSISLIFVLAALRIGLKAAVIARQA
jgi:hypothetical protein